MEILHERLPNLIHGDDAEDSPPTAHDTAAQPTAHTIADTPAPASAAISRLQSAIDRLEAAVMAKLEEKDAPASATAKAPEHAATTASATGHDDDHWLGLMEEVEALRLENATLQESLADAQAAAVRGRQKRQAVAERLEKSIETLELLLETT